MLRLVARRFGPPAEVLSVETAPRPQPGPAGAVVRMLASAINPSDLLTIRGAYPQRTPLPFVPGFEGVGVVEALGPATTGLGVGQRVLPLGSAGGWQGLKALPAEWCVPVPEDLTDDQAATAYVNPLTARLMLRALAPTPGALIGINAAGSAIGRMLLRMLRAAGARPVAILRSAASVAALEEEPAAEVVVEGFPLPRLDGGFDAVGGAAGAALAAAIRPGGTMIHYGLLSGVPLPPELGRRDGVAVRPFWLRSWVHAAPRAALRETMAEVFGDIRSGLATTAVAAHYPIIDFAAALAHDALPGRGGKVLLVPG
ncbi:zinc-dependent alcohol dehydrogenase family protein [Inquilinus limosus]|uniref:zinc-dependent alcohol dehydrogenase family protein n=1 Tax=Inquilinus limosus TaxID=171674 RepID=UPI00047B7F2F|nr:zinc-dependent alcohol dehydrogenase family protein [Inquilinus limosus]